MAAKKTKADKVFSEYGEGCIAHAIHTCRSQWLERERGLDRGDDRGREDVLE